MRLKGNKAKESNIILTAVIILSLVIAMSYAALVFIPLALNQAAWALTGNYSKTDLPPNNNIGVSEWNNLPNDFLNLSGDTMSGDLNMGGSPITNLAVPVSPADAANKQYTDGMTTGVGPIQDASGNALRAVCGQTAQGFTNWRSEDGNTVYVDVNTAGASFSSLPRYFTSLGGRHNHYVIVGSTSVYQATVTGFRIYVRHLSRAITPEEANCDNPGVDRNSNGTPILENYCYGWFVNWCGLGN